MDKTNGNQCVILYKSKYIYYNEYILCVDKKDGETNKHKE